MITARKEAELTSRMLELGVHEDDLLEKFVRGSGPGGQKINKTSSCVYLLHRPSGIEIKCQQSRSQSLNRFIARRELCEKLTEKLTNELSQRQQAQEKIRRQKRRRSRRQKERMLEGKKHRAEVKEKRKPIKPGRI